MTALSKFTIYALVILALYCSGWAVAHASQLPNCDRHSDDDQIALACNLYYEARSESDAGVMAVVAVTLNRVASPHYPNSVRGVVWQNRQFSWTHDGLVDTPANRRAWNRMMRIASRFTMPKWRRKQLCPTANQINARAIGRPDPGCEPYQNIVAVHAYLATLVDPTGGALFYHTVDVRPYWQDPASHTVTIRKHVFYVKARLARR